MRWRTLSASVLPSLIFAIFLWAMDFPKPQFDDMFYMGAGLHMAEGGDFSNPMLDRQGFPGHNFFVYPPLQSYVVEGWVKLLGINRWTVLALQVLCFFVTCVATISLFRLYGISRWLDSLVPLGLLIELLAIGLRPEPLAFALTLVGFALAIWRCEAIGSLFIGFLLMFLGASCAPRVTVFAGALALFAALKAREKALPDRKKGSLIIILWLGALALVGLSFLVIIKFQIHDFWQMFHFHSRRIEGRTFYAFKVLRVLQWPLLLVPLGFLIAAWRKKNKTEVERVAFFIAGAFGLTIFTGGIGPSSLWWPILIMLLLAGSFLKTAVGKKKSAILLVTFLTILVADRRFFAECYGQLCGKIDLSQGPQLQQALSIRPTPDHPVLIDNSTARYVYDYRIPAGCLSFEFGSHFPGELPGDLSASELIAGDIYIITPQIAAVMRDTTHLQVSVPEWQPLGLRGFVYNQSPRHVYILGPDDIKGPREHRRF